MSEIAGQVNLWRTSYNLLEQRRAEIRSFLEPLLQARRSTVILCGGDKGSRLTLPNTRILLHQPSQAMRGVASDVEISGREILRIRARINDLLAAECGKTVDEIEKDLNRDFWMTAQQAVDYGLLDKVIENTAEEDAL